MVELQAPARIHAPWQRHRRQKSAAPGMTIRADLALTCQRRKIKPMREWRNIATGHGQWIVAVQRSRQRGERGGCDFVGAPLRAADPVTQVFKVFSHGLKLKAKRETAPLVIAQGTRHQQSAIAT